MVSALAAVALGLAAVVYAVWPLFREGRATEPLEDDGCAWRNSETVRAAVLEWAVAAGEMDAGNADDVAGSARGRPDRARSRDDDGESSIGGTRPEGTPG